jgi:hypothetical protein
MKTKPCQKPVTRWSPPQPLLALDPPNVIPQSTRQQCLALLAEILKHIIHHERKDTTNER